MLRPYALHTCRLLCLYDRLIQVTVDLNDVDLSEFRDKSFYEFLNVIIFSQN